MISLGPVELLRGLWVEAIQSVWTHGVTRATKDAPNSFSPKLGSKKLDTDICHLLGGGFRRKPRIYGGDFKCLGIS